MKKKYDFTIKKHYNKIAKKQKLSPLSTMNDKFTRNAETNFILDELIKFRKNKIKIVDVGCGNGYTLYKISKISKNFNLTGIEPNKLLRDLAKKRLRKKANIVNRDIRDLKNFNEKFDILICQRVIINILNLNEQKQSLENIIKLVKTGGKLIFIEAFMSGIKNLNYVRKKFSLKKLNHAYHNKYLSDNFFNNKKLKEIQHNKTNMLSSHYLIARVLHPIYLKASKEKFKFNSYFVKFFDKIFPEIKVNYSQVVFRKFIKTKNRNSQRSLQ